MKKVKEVLRTQAEQLQRAAVAVAGPPGSLGLSPFTNGLMVGNGNDLATSTSPGITSATMGPSGFGDPGFGNVTEAGHAGGQEEVPLNVLHHNSAAKEHVLSVSEADKENLGKNFNPTVVSFIRDDWIMKQMKNREAEFTDFGSVKVFAGTWNVNAKRPMGPPECALEEWLATASDVDQQPDIFCIGFQEIVDLNAANVVADGKSKERSQQWAEVLERTLNTMGTAKYHLALERHLVGILLCVFVQKRHIEHVSDVQGCTAGVGVMGVMGNKGGVAIRMTLYDSTICFVCAHLAAHRENVAARNSDFGNIVSKVSFKDELSMRSNGMDTSYPLLNHDYVVWVGDLNYRIVEDIPIEECFQKIEDGDIDYLSSRDQLNIERKAGNVFQGFDEGPLRFNPTYKYQCGTSDYERRPDKKLRAPAWCDRVLWRVRGPPSEIKQLEYARAELDLSDHKPVKAAFEAKIKMIVKDKQRQIYQEVMRRLDNWENENKPKVQIHSNFIRLGDIRYLQSGSSIVVIENIGQVVAHFRFIPKMEEKVICKPWLAVSPAFGMIIPGEKCEIKLTAAIDNDTAQMLTKGCDTLDDIIVLRVENGQDSFMTVSATYLSCCFGTSLAQLVKIRSPVRQVDFSERSSYQAPDNSDGTTQFGENNSTSGVPKELWRMIDAIHSTAMEEKALFLEAGTPDEVAALREALDTGGDFPDHSPHSMAELLLTFLASLRNHLIPPEISPPSDLDATNIANYVKIFLDKLPPVHHNVLIYLISFLRELLKHKHANKLSPEKLAFVFSKVIIAQPKQLHGVEIEDAELSRLRSAMQMMLMHFLTAIAV